MFPSSVWWLLATPLAPWVVVLPGGRWLLPLLVPLALYPSFRPLIRDGRYPLAWGLGMSWAALLSIGVIVLVQLRPEAAQAGILHGEAYRAEMFQWIVTGEGREASLRAFLPEHLLHLVLFVLLTWASAGYLGLALGAVLMGYMSYFVGAFAAASSDPLLAATAGWVPWSVVRVAAFVLLGALFARPLLVGRAWPFGGREYRLMAVAAAGIAVDLVTKALAAPAYGELLRQLLP